MVYYTLYLAKLSQ